MFKLAIFPGSQVLAVLQYMSMHASFLFQPHLIIIMYCEAVKLIPTREKNVQWNPPLGRVLIRVVRVLDFRDEILGWNKTRCPDYVLISGSPHYYFRGSTSTVHSSPSSLDKSIFSSEGVPAAVVYPSFSAWQSIGSAPSWPLSFASHTWTISPLTLSVCDHAGNYQICYRDWVLAEVRDYLRGPCTILVAIPGAIVVEACLLGSRWVVKIPFRREGCFLKGFRCETWVHLSHDNYNPWNPYTAINFVNNWIFKNLFLATFMLFYRGRVDRGWYNYSYPWVSCIIPPWL